MAPTTQQLDQFLGGIGLAADQIESITNAAEQLGQYAEHTLAKLYPGDIDLPGTEAYTQSVKGFWSLLARRDASAVFHPYTTEQVAKALEILEFFDQPFAVRGGGHSPNPEWASIQDGLLISTDRLNSLHYDENSKIVSIAAGNRWGMVYRYLEKFGVLVTGGHSAPVGCVGQITGCGNSPWFHKYGWSCDNVLNFEVVVTGGKIINANRDENADLWWALKGGSNNFGIVTRMDMSTFPVPEGVWGGQLEFEWSPELQRKTVEAYYKFQMECIARDPGVESLSGWGVSDGEKYIQKVVSADRHVPNGGHPEAFDDFYALKPTGLAGNCKPSELAAHDDLSTGSHDQTVYFSETTRSSMLCLVVKADLDYFQEAVNIFYDT
ncbi:AGC/RSK protein kinase [Fusarium sp. LHS14.1]|nr:AGC/RSK protein kinase [Fusarium sp. LHS14.1]